MYVSKYVLEINVLWCSNAEPKKNFPKYILSYVYSLSPVYEPTPKQRTSQATWFLPTWMDLVYFYLFGKKTLFEDVFPAELH